MALAVANLHAATQQQHPHPMAHTTNSDIQEHATPGTSQDDDANVSKKRKIQSLLCDEEENAAVYEKTDKEDQTTPLPPQPHAASAVTPHAHHQQAQAAAIMAAVMAQHQQQDAAADGASQHGTQQHPPVLPTSDGLLVQTPWGMVLHPNHCTCATCTSYHGQTTPKQRDMLASALQKQQLDAIIQQFAAAQAAAAQAALASAHQQQQTHRKSKTRHCR